MFRFRPPGKYHLQVCTCVPCCLVGGPEILEHLEHKLGIHAGHTTKDGFFSIEEMECIGACAYAPAMIVNEDYVEQLTPEKIDQLLDSLATHTRAENPCLRKHSFSSATSAPPDMMALWIVTAKQVVTVFAKSLGDATRRGGCLVKEAGLRGRGGAGFPTGLKWSFMAKNTGKPSYLVCNADESEPGTCKDRELMLKDPHLFLEGMMIGCYALGCHHGYIYVRGEYFPAIKSLNKAIDDCYRAGILGPKLLGGDYALDLTVHTGAGAYICGEESALLDSLEGKRGHPRVKPPFPAVAGFNSCPTSVNNVETLTNVTAILEMGADAYKWAVPIMQEPTWSA